MSEENLSKTLNEKIHGLALNIGRHETDAVVEALNELIDFKIREATSELLERIQSLEYTLRMKGNI